MSNQFSWSKNQMSVIYVLFVGLAFSDVIFGTIDLTLPEFQYLANHLTKDECHKLIASLHFDSFDLNENIENAENAVPDDVSCLKLLLHWNSTPNEGRGATHEKVSLRLRQMGKQKLADWLDVAVLQELEEEIVNTAEEFKDKETEKETPETLEDDLEEQFLVDFTLMDFLMIAAGAGCVLAACITVLIVGHRIYRRYRDSKLDTRKIVEERYEDRLRGSKMIENCYTPQNAYLNENGERGSLKE